MSGQGGALAGLYRLMRSTGIYRLDGDTLVDHELAAYGAAFAPLETALDTLLREGFIATAEDAGLSAYERIMGEPDRTGLAAADRRGMLLYRLSILPGDFDPQGMADALRSVGLEAEILEEFANRRLTIRQLDYRGARETFDLIVRDCEKLLPAHLELFFDLGALSWDGFDSEDLTFDARDALDLSWDQFEAQPEPDSGTEP